jgi:hypothetical protein
VETRKTITHSAQLFSALLNQFIIQYHQNLQELPHWENGFEKIYNETAKIEKPKSPQMLPRLFCTAQQQYDLYSLYRFTCVGCSSHMCGLQTTLLLSCQTRDLLPLYGFAHVALSLCCMIHTCGPLLVCCCMVLAGN